jgi:hypothetical protein
MASTSMTRPSGLRMILATTKKKKTIKPLFKKSNRTWYHVIIFSGIMLTCRHTVLPCDLRRFAQRGRQVRRREEAASRRRAGQLQLPQRGMYGMTMISVHKKNRQPRIFVQTNCSHLISSTYTAGRLSPFFSAHRPMINGARLWEHSSIETKTPYTK